MVIPLVLDSSRDTPLYRQIRDGIIRLVDEGTLRAGASLPSSRRLSGDVGAHRSTVVRAYAELRALGYIESRPGSYTTIRRRARPSTPTVHEAPEPVIDWTRIARNARSLLGEYGRLETLRPEPSENAIDLDRLSADPRLAPNAAVRRCMRNILLQTGASTLDYAHPGGWAPLRKALAQRMRVHGVDVSPDEILPTSGAQHALDLILRTFAKEGDRVIVEAPTYGMVHSLIRLHRLRPVEIPMRDTGMDLDRLERVLRRPGRHRPRLLYTMPSFHNPTGITTEHEHRERLLHLCEMNCIPVIEDGFEEELKYTGRAVLPLKSLDQRGIVIYVGTFSKVVFPGLRVGWVAATAMAITRLTDVLLASNLSGNTLAQAAAARFCATGEFEAHLRRVHRVYRGRMRSLLRSLEQHMPPGVQWTRPRGGYTAWLTLPAPAASEKEIISRIHAEGVRVSPGSRCFGRVPRSVLVRLSIACADEAEIDTGCRLIGRALSEALPRSSR